MSGAKVLVVDAGGRGNAIAHVFARSENVDAVYVAPGNAGSEMMEKCHLATMTAERQDNLRTAGFRKARGHRSHFRGSRRLSVRWYCQCLPGGRPENTGPKEGGGHPGR